MDMKNEKLQEYAKLLIEVGLHVQKGQTLVISSPVECAYFARLCATAAYDVGCREVVMNWHDDYLAREKFLRAEDAVFDQVPQWRQHFFNDYANEGAAYLAIDAEDPEHLKGVDPDRRVRSLRVSGKAVRITGDGQSVRHWQEHLESLSRRKEKLNALRLKSLHYTNSLGTDLTVELPADHIWEAGDDCTSAGQPFVANMPTEELFTAPLRTGANGTVVASMPLVHDGNIIDGFRMTVENGRITSVSAKQGQAVLEAAISVDEGASYFGEVALVPYDSPISNQKLLFYNTLFDENAACHIAFGEAYPCIDGGRDMDKEQLKAHGLNDSVTHVDFMVGTADLSIVGTTRDGREVPIFVNGNFAL